MNLGLHDIEIPTYLFISKEATDKGNFGWYTLAEENGLAVKKLVSQKALTGKLEKLELKAVEVKAGKKTESKLKLDIHFRCGSDKYVVRTGLDTTFYKSILLKLNALTSAQLGGLITLIANPSVDSPVVFAGIKVGEENIKATWDAEADFASMIDTINEKLEGIESQAIKSPSPAEERDLSEEEMYSILESEKEEYIPF